MENINFLGEKRTYLLPIKKQVRIKEDIANGIAVNVNITIDKLN